jgi:hypothetical protein
MTLRNTRVVILAVAVAVAAVATLGAQTKPAAEKWTGNISDSMCGKSHGANGGTMAKDHDCTLKCVKGGSQYVFVVGDKIFKIADQKMAALEQHAGHKVEIEGTLKGDTITVTKVTMLPVK